MYMYVFIYIYIYVYVYISTASDTEEDSSQRRCSTTQHATDQDRDSGESDETSTERLEWVGR